MYSQPIAAYPAIATSQILLPTTTSIGLPVNPNPSYIRPPTSYPSQPSRKPSRCSTWQSLTQVASIAVCGSSSHWPSSASPSAWSWASSSICWWWRSGELPHWSVGLGIIIRGFAGGYSWCLWRRFWSLLGLLQRRVFVGGCRSIGFWVRRGWSGIMRFRCFRRNWEGAADSDTYWWLDYGGKGLETARVMDNKVKEIL